jgi:acetyltransferase-like isoleucine patch superfamily enzyme
MIMDNAFGCNMLNYLFVPINLIRRAIRVIRSLLLSRLIDDGKGRFIICDHDLRVNIRKGKNAKIILNGKCKLSSWLGGKTPINIHLGENATLLIDGDFTIGHGVGILVGGNAKLSIGGCKSESGSGITCDTKIMVNKNLNVGKDFICSWDVFITDSDWHLIEGQVPTKEVVIADHVWIANSCSILKGTTIGSGCIVASHSKLAGTIYPENSVIGGVPAKVIKHPVRWQRDM